ncbi:MAG: methyltransferase domain-containing protein [archaeon]
MNDKLLGILSCPLCKSSFRYSGKTITCGEGHMFLVVDGIPNLIPQIERYKKTELSFSKEWGIMKKEGIPDMDNVRKLFLNDFNTTKEKMKGKYTLEAGCGRGYLEMAVSELVGKRGLAVGLDMSTSIMMYSNRKNNLSKIPDSAQYVRGNIDRAPFKKGSFDMIYSFGVLHHTPNTYNAFKTLLPLLKKRGKFYLGLYRKDRKDDTKIVSLIYASRGFVNKLPITMIYAICWILAPFAKVYAEINTRNGRRPAFNKTTKEFMWSLFDHFSPEYVHRHTITEIEEWFRKEGFKTELKMEDRIGFAVLGTKK